MGELKGRRGRSAGGGKDELWPRRDLAVWPLWRLEHQEVNRGVERLRGEGFYLAVREECDRTLVPLLSRVRMKQFMQPRGSSQEAAHANNPHQNGCHHRS